MARIGIDARNVEELTAILGKLEGCYKVAAIHAELEFLETRTVAVGEFTITGIKDMIEALEKNKKPVAMPMAKKTRKYKLRAQKPDPFDLVKNKGWVARGPYPHKGNKPELVVTNPANLYKEKVTYSIGTQISQEDVDKLKLLSKENEKNVVDKRRRGLKEEYETVEPEKPKEKLPEPQIEGCPVCSKTGLALGACKTMKEPHCLGCCDKFQHKVE